MTTPNKIMFHGAVYVKTAAGNKPATKKCKCGKKTLKLNTKSDSYVCQISSNSGKHIRHCPKTCHETKINPPPYRGGRGAI